MRTDHALNSEMRTLKSCPFTHTSFTHNDLDTKRHRHEEPCAEMLHDLSFLLTRTIEDFFSILDDLCGHVLLRVFMNFTHTNTSVVALTIERELVRKISHKIEVSLGRKSQAYLITTLFPVRFLHSLYFNLHLFISQFR